MKRSAIVTGGAGFIGSHVVDALIADSYRVVVVDDLSTGAASRVATEAELEVVDIAHRQTLDSVFDHIEPDAVFHLGAQSMVTVSVIDPWKDCAVNVQGTLNVLQAAQRHSAPIVFTSTGGALYGNDARIPTNEESPPAPVAPYGASKWAGEAYVLTWARASGIKHSVCRLGNVYGPRQSPHGEAGVVSILSHKLWRSKTATLFGFGTPTRDYVHVSDVVDALVRASGRGGVFNVATGQETSVLDLYGHIQAAAGTDIEPDLAPLRAGELQRSCMDPSRAHATLGWSAEIPLRDGVESTFRALIGEFERAG